MSSTRARIAEHVAERPGVHFNGLVRALDLAPGQVQYHLRHLLAGGNVTAEEVYGRTHYYPPEFEPWERDAIALLRRETARDLVTLLVERGPTAPAEAADALGIARSTLEWHLGRLEDRGLVVKHRDDRNRVTLALARPADIVRLLDEVDPSLPDRMVDRFTRLVDDLLESRGP